MHWLWYGTERTIGSGADRESLGEFMSKSSAASGEAKSASKKPTETASAKRPAKSKQETPARTARKTKKTTQRKRAAAPQRQALVVLGMHRSGTSALTGVLERLGAGGPENKLPPNEFNVKGYGESRVFMRLHDRFWSRPGPAGMIGPSSIRVGPRALSRRGSVLKSATPSRPSMKARTSSSSRIRAFAVSRNSGCSRSKRWRSTSRPS